MAMQFSTGKDFTKPTPGMYIGIVADIVETPNVQTAFGIKNRVRIHWLLFNLATGQLMVDAKGEPIEAVAFVNASAAPTGDLTTKFVTPILGQVPPPITSTELLEQLIMNRANVLILTQAPNPKDPSKPFVNVTGIGPIQAGMPAPAGIPSTYVRAKNKPQQTSGPQPGQVTNTYPTAPGYAPAPVPNAYIPAPPTPTPTVNLNAAAPQPNLVPGTPGLKPF
jgi:hypothetical protein